MKKREAVNSTIKELKEAFRTDIPKLVELAHRNDEFITFKQDMRSLLLNRLETVGKNEKTKNAAKRILLMIDYDQTEVNELSTGKSLPIHTFTHLWNFLRSHDSTEQASDAIIDLYHLFMETVHPIEINLEKNSVIQQMKRWKTGLDKDVITIRERNKKRIINCLIERIERHHTTSRYHFKEDMTYHEKYEQTTLWWNMYQFHLFMAARSPREINHFMGKTLSHETMQLLYQAKSKGIPFFVTPYYLSLLNTENEGYDDSSIRSYIFYSQELVETFGNIHAWEKEDLVKENEPNAAGWLLPGGHNMHRRYPDVAIMIPDSMGRACGGLCASCQRMYDFQNKHLNFNLKELLPKESWDKKLRQLMNYFEEDTQLRDILITGGDALMSQDATLRKILAAVYRMAVRKRKANENRADGEKFAELQRVRLGSRLPVYLPFRIGNSLIQILKEFKEKASTVGITQFYIQTHFQSPLEVTPEAKQSIKDLLSAGWTVTNQLVYNVAVSRRGHTTKLRRILNSIGVVCYYTFSVKGFQENYAVFTPNSRSLQEANEEKIVGHIPEDKQEELRNLVMNEHPLGKKLINFLTSIGLPFAATDRSVLNLPGIGKSMTFTTVGITEKGQRILKFNHDRTRWHSPAINKMGEVFIVENKSIAAYLRQLQAMGENIDDYNTIWNYCEGETEPRFNLYEYPAFTYQKTLVVNHIMYESPRINIREKLTDYSEVC